MAGGRMWLVAALHAAVVVGNERLAHTDGIHVLDELAGICLVAERGSSASEWNDALVLLLKSR